jgi:hypothetical protein
MIFDVPDEGERFRPLIGARSLNTMPPARIYWVSQLFCEIDTSGHGENQPRGGEGEGHLLNTRSE